MTKTPTENKGCSPPLSPLSPLCSLALLSHAFSPSFTPAHSGPPGLCQEVREEKSMKVKRNNDKKDVLYWKGCQSSQKWHQISYTIYWLIAVKTRQIGIKILANKYFHVMAGNWKILHFIPFCVNKIKIKPYKTML